MTFSEWSASSAVLVEISKAVLDSQKEIWIPLKGNCMWPVVKNGDELKIVKVPYADLRSGDIAIFQTTAKTFHANIIFKKSDAPENYIGKVTEIRRNKKILNLDERKEWSRMMQVLAAPANPYLLNLPRTLLRKFFRSASH